MKFINTQEINKEAELRERLLNSEIKVKENKARKSSQTKKKITGMAMDSELYEKLTEYCKKRYISKSLLMENALREYIKKNNLFEI